MTLIPTDGSKPPRMAYVLVTMGLVGVAIVLGAVNLSMAPSGRGAGVMTDTVVVPTATEANYIPTPVPGPPLVTAEMAARLPFTRSFGTWSYTVDKTLDPSMNLLYVLIKFDYESAEGIRVFQATNRQLATELASDGGEIDAVITFKRYLTMDELRSWSHAHRSRVSNIYFHQDNDPSQPTLVYGNTLESMDERDPWADDYYDKLMNSGAFRVDATFSSTHLLEITEDPLVFLADVTPNTVRRDLVAQGFGRYEEWGGVPFGVHSPFEEQKEFGLADE
jgi:hypothetical protein